MKTIVTALLTCGLFAGCALAAPSAAPSPAAAAKPLEVPILGVGGTPIGKAVLTEAPTGVLIRLGFEPGALSPGWHGLHLHEKADCTDKGVFKLSGGHVGHGLGGKQHGLLNPAGPEMGDLPNLYVPTKAGGVFMAEVFSPFVTLAAAPVGARASLRDGDGSALIVHAKADDHATQPIGGAGDRIACAAIKG